MFFFPSIFQSLSQLLLPPSLPFPKASSLSLLQRSYFLSFFVPTPPKKLLPFFYSVLYLFFSLSSSLPILSFHIYSILSPTPFLLLSFFLSFLHLLCFLLSTPPFPIFSSTPPSLSPPALSLFPSLLSSTHSLSFSIRQHFFCLPPSLTSFL